MASDGSNLVTLTRFYVDHLCCFKLSNNFCKQTRSTRPNIKYKINDLGEPLQEDVEKKFCGFVNYFLVREK